MYHNSVEFELKEVLDFLLVSFPLTLSVAALVVIIQREQLNLFSLTIAVVGAALISNLLHALIHYIPSVDISKPFKETYDHPVNTNDNNSGLKFIGKIFSIYWKTFGPVLFIQSCCVGIYAGVKFLNLEKKRKELKNEGVKQIKKGSI